ncbi:single-stranded DNA-binding protein [Lacticaseibacillus paracasei]|uniref:single-stranded DNA-binding protein n=1 Tax=Lacticaseibacillus paracasei TaxID=1597 RepID=UPI0008DCC6EE|nr:single-stranded DNA-binding protein [Lacticaseibacillus paracasei]OHY44412.1 single-stranded DNA-binding protein [Lacticaseibacillus paracasei]QPC20664.1 single-stranded DNA-binding protein [Lacticaseibacillus paracasei subsp. tolerans]
MNSVSLIGNIATSVKSGNGSATTMLAVHRIYQTKDKQTADFVPIVAFGKMGEVLNNYASKGTQICISGRIRTGQYERDGKTEYTWQVVAEHIYLLSSKPHNDASKDSSAKLSDDLINSLSTQLSGLKDSDLPF